MAEISYAVRSYVLIAGLWVRASLQYRLSFWMTTIGGVLVTFLDFVGVWLMFANIDRLGGFSLREVALLYGMTGMPFRLADMLVGSVEKLGAYVRSGALDTMMTKPVPVLVQLCADRWELRRLGQILQAVLVFAWAVPVVEWTPLRVLVAILAVASGTVIFFCVFTAFSSVQFWTSDASEFANAFTYGGTTLTQYPLSIFTREVVKGLTYVLPLAFVNWYPCLYLLGRADTYGAPSWYAFLPPVAAAAAVCVAALVWRTGIRHYRSTGS